MRFIPKLRPGHTYRIYDIQVSRDRRKRFLVVALDHEAHGGMLSPAISIHWTGKNGSVFGYGPKRHWQLDLPKWRWLWWTFMAPDKRKRVWDLHRATR